MPTAGSQARWALGVLLAVNLLNYLDRQVLYAVLPLLKTEFSATDAQLGALASAFMLVYMCAAPVIGYLADRSSRTAWIASGVGIWSLATVFSGLAGSFRQLVAARAAVGIGESSYGSVSPSFVAEYFPKTGARACSRFFRWRFRSAPPWDTLWGEWSAIVGGGGKHFIWPESRESSWRCWPPGCGIRKPQCKKNDPNHPACGNTSP